MGVWTEIAVDFRNNPMNFLFLHVNQKDFILSIRLLKVAILVSAVVLLADGCASSHKNKKLKPGKPIPCPHKDC